MNGKELNAKLAEQKGIGVRIKNMNPRWYVYGRYSGGAEGHNEFTGWEVFESGYPYLTDDGAETTPPTRFIAAAANEEDLFRALSMWDERVHHPRFGFGTGGIYVVYGSMQTATNPDIFNAREDPVYHVDISIPPQPK